MKCVNPFLAGKIYKEKKRKTPGKVREETSFPRRTEEQRNEDGMKEEQKRKITQLLWYGIAGAVLTMIGDFLLLGVDSTGAEGAISQYLMAAEKISYTRIGLAGFFGFVGIPVTAFGYYALYQMMEDRKSAAARWYKASVYAFAAFGGAIHIICCYLVTGMKKALETGTESGDILAMILKEQGGYLIPCFVVFFAFYLINVIMLIYIIAKKKTPLPGWMWILNPLLFKILINGFGKLGTSAFFNGTACANMSLGALIILVAWMIVIRKRK